MSEFLAVKLNSEGPVISVITPSYFQAISQRAPSFYAHLIHEPFSSSLSMTQLTALLPFRLTPGGVESVSTAVLSKEEEKFLEAHRGLLALYWENGFEPRPPWELFPLSIHEIMDLPHVLEALKIQIAAEKTV
jgi:hypothetical protein